MKARVPILICGDAGPSRHTLLARRDLETFWTDTAQGAVATMRQVSPKVCVVRPKDMAGNAMELIAACAGGPPCVVLLGRDEWSRQPTWLAAGASDVVELEQSQALIDLIAQYTGLAFAKEQRIRFETVVEVHVNGEQLVLETVDISASGAALRGLPDLEPDTLVRIAFVVRAEPIVLWARTVRGWRRDGVSMGGVRFVGMTMAQTLSLREFVESESARVPQPVQNFDNLFEGIAEIGDQPRALDSLDLTETLGSDDALGLDPDVASLQRWVRAEDETERESLDLPRWLLWTAEALTDVEMLALTGKAEPSWARKAVKVRVALNRWRAAHVEGPPPAHISERAYDFFASLGSETKRETDEVLVQVGRIRAAILRELLSSQSVRPVVARAQPELRIVNG